MIVWDFFVILFPSLLFTAILLSMPSENQINYGIKQCQNDKKMFKSSRMTKSGYNAFCECYIRGVNNLVDDEEIAYQKKHKKPSPKLIKESKYMTVDCAS